MPGLSTGVAHHVYGDKTTQDRAVVAAHEHNISCTLVWAFNMLGMPMQPLIIESKGGREIRGPMSSLTKPEHVFKQYPAILWEVTQNGFITKTVFLRWAYRLRAYVNNTQPILLLSDGHSSRTDYNVVKQLLQLNIHLLLIPANTSHALSASDQFHQHLHRKRLAFDYVVSSLRNMSPSRDDKLESLLKACYAFKDKPSLMRSAFKHAGVTGEKRCVSLLKNRPALDVESLDNAATTSVRGGGSRAETPTTFGTGHMSSPTTSQIDALSPHALLALCKRYKTERTSRNLASLLTHQVALAERKPRDLRQQHKEREAARLTVRFDGPLDDVAIMQALADREGRNQAKQNRRTRTDEEKAVGSRLRHMLDEPDTRCAPVRAELVAALEHMEVTPPQKGNQGGAPASCGRAP